jgi:hypothetical protein
MPLEMLRTAISRVAYPTLWYWSYCKEPPRESLVPLRSMLLLLTALSLPLPCSCPPDPAPAQLLCLMLGLLLSSVDHDALHHPERHVGAALPRAVGL